MQSTKIQFNEFAKQYCGIDNREEQIQLLKDSLISYDTNDEITEAELNELFDTECQIEQTYFEPNDYFDIIINKMWACMSLVRIIE